MDYRTKSLLPEALLGLTGEHPHQSIVGVLFEGIEGRTGRFDFRLRHSNGWSKRSMLWMPPAPNTHDVDAFTTRIGDDCYRWILSVRGGIHGDLFAEDVGSPPG